MKVSAALLLLSITRVSGQCLSSWPVDTNNGCSYDSLLSGLQPLLSAASCGHGPLQELEIILSDVVDDDVPSKIAKICGEAHLPFSAISKQGHVFDKAYYDGGTYWNEQRQAKDEYDITENVLEYDPASIRIKNIYDTIAQSNGIGWPSSTVTNFDSCELRSVMCCFVQDRQANDNNGNCATPYDEKCVDKDPADNTDICYADMSKAPTSNRVGGGFAIFEGETEGDAHCHGIAWSNDATHPSARYKANNLFYISMYDHLYQRGYVRNVPGSPMCGCVEQMPVVTRSDCTQIDVVSEDATFSYTGTGGLVATITNLDIEFNSCQGADNKNNNLSAHYQRLVNEGEATAAEKVMLDQYLVGPNNCQAAIYNFLDQQGLQKKPPSLDGYVLNSLEQSWQWHDLNAQNQGCQLASASTASENESILAVAQQHGIGSKTTLWIGGTHTSTTVADPTDGTATTWMWSDTSVAWSFTKWAQGQYTQPNGGGAGNLQDAVAIMTAPDWSGTFAGDWQDKSGTEPHAAVYKCPPTTTRRKLLRA